MNIVSRYLQGGSPTKCSFCGGPFITVDRRVQCVRGQDNRYYCSQEHADFVQIHGDVVPPLIIPGRIAK